MPLRSVLEAYPPVLPRRLGSAVHSWLIGQCLDSETEGTLGVWPWFHPTIQLDRPMLLLLLPGEWLRFEKKIDYCLEILVPEWKMKLGWPIETEEMVKSARGKMLTCFRRISSKFEPAGIEGCNEELGIAIFGWPDNSDSAWSASWRIIVRICRMYLRASSEIIPVSTGNLPWFSWELKVNVVPNKIKR